MICPSYASAADAITHALCAGDLTEPTGHDPAVCTDLLCPCQHQPIKREGEPDAAT